MLLSMMQRASVALCAEAAPPVARRAAPRAIAVSFM
jgi:hypothetical protein